MSASVADPPMRTQALPSTLFPLGVGAPAGGSIVFCPDYGGNVLYARPLVPLLASDLQCLGLRLTPDLLEAAGGVEIQALGRRYAADIHAAGLAAPVHLFGFSFGGIIAFETARYLSQLQPHAARLWIIDTAIHRLFLHRYLWPGGLWRELEHAAWWLRMNRRRLLNPAAAPDVLHRYRQIRFDLREHPQAIASVIRMLYAAQARYRPQPWRGHATVVRARLGRWPHVGDDLGWRHLIEGELSTVPLQTNHSGTLQNPDSVHQVARIIADPLHRSIGRKSA